MKIQKQTVQPERTILKTYSQKELEDFEKYVEKFYEDYEITNGKDAGKIIRPLNWEKLSFDYGATNKYRAVIITDGVLKIDELYNIYSQCQKMKNKRDLIQGKKLEFLESITKDLVVDTSFEKEREDF